MKGVEYNLMDGQKIEYSPWKLTQGQRGHQTKEFHLEPCSRNSNYKGKKMEKSEGIL